MASVQREQEKRILACALAANALKNKEVERIILARPAVEAGESLGFLPGDLQDKVDPYLRPLYDAIFEIVGQETAARLRESGGYRGCTSSLYERSYTR